MHCLYPPQGDTPAQGKNCKLQVTASDFEVLKAKNLTQKDFAQRLHKRESEISKWLTGRHNFTIQTIAKIETTLGCKLINIAR